MREDIKNWVRMCAHCIAYNAWRTRQSELYFSWPITVPFWIMHVDLWSPGTTTDDAGHKGYLMNSMCDLTQFVVSSPTTDITSVALAELFMSTVVLTFGMCSVVVVDDGSNFKNVFLEMCKKLNIHCWVLSRGNHKGNSVEHYHRFINKTQAIAGNDRGTHSIFANNAKTSQYAWNSSPIDGTDITRSMAAIGRDFRFPLDVNLTPTPTLNSSSNASLFQYLRDVSLESKFAVSILQILIKERREYHQNRHNTKVSKCALKIGDVVKAHVQVKSDSNKGIVGKLSYKAKGPFIITADLGFDSYEVQRYDDKTSATRKYKSTELYLLPPALFPSSPLDTIDQRYLDSRYAPIVNPLKAPLRIELYNDKWLQSSSSHVNTASSIIDQPSSESDAIAFSAHRPTQSPRPPSPLSNQPLPNIVRPNRVDDEPTSRFDDDDASRKYEGDHCSSDVIAAPLELTMLSTSISSSKSKLCFISYTPVGTMLRRWYLVQICMEATIEIEPQYLDSGKYYANFLAKHPGDTNFSDEESRWWPDWYRYSRDSSGDIVFGDRILFRPGIFPNSSKYIQWADTVDLSDPAVFLSGPFDFEPITSSNRTRSKVALT